MDRRNRRVALVGALLYLAGSGLNLVGQFTEARWVLIPALVLWICGVVVVLVAATRYVNGRRNR